MQCLHNLTAHSLEQEQNTLSENEVMDQVRWSKFSETTMGRYITYLMAKCTTALTATICHLLGLCKCASTDISL